ncbi:MAG: lytic transglycosylase domain-containing protein [Alphaproteobacteria bacterium]|nr:lytic transglycosylase domain-containing protein [Alphaproteobacteria bacterium]
MARRIFAILLLFLSVASMASAEGEAPALPKTKEERQIYATEICAQISAQAHSNDIPEHYLARLIWKESLFDPGAVSPKGAQGIAQFMPGTARLRGLADPFDPNAALAAAAAYLAELKRSFGNLGHAAAAYNAGEERARRWLAGDSGLPFETQDYVVSITGHSAEEWKQDGADFAIAAIGEAGDFAGQCASLVMRELSPQAAPGERAPWKPWGVVISGGFSEARALLAFRTIRNRYSGLIGNEKPMVRRKKNLSMGRRAMVRVMIGRDSRAAAQALCTRLTALGGACLVEKN